MGQNRINSLAIVCIELALLWQSSHCQQYGQGYKYFRTRPRKKKLFLIQQDRAELSIDVIEYGRFKITVSGIITVSEDVAISNFFVSLKLQCVYVPISMLKHSGIVQFFFGQEDHRPLPSPSPNVAVRLCMDPRFKFSYQWRSEVSVTNFVKYRSNISPYAGRKRGLHIQRSTGLHHGNRDAQFKIKLKRHLRK